MLAIDEDLMILEQAIEKFVTAFCRSAVAINYKEKRKLFLEDSSLQHQIVAFQDLQKKYQELEVFSAYRPEIKELRRKIYQTKRIIDLDDKVVAFRQAEVAVQECLANLSKDLSAAVSETIFVDTGLPLAPHKKHHSKGWGNNIREGK